MRVLVIDGSPKGRQGNTFRLTQAFLDGLAMGEKNLGNGAPDVDVADVAELSIAPCKGCFSCWRATPGECCIHDDMAALLPRLVEADVVVWSFPLYYFGMPGPLKNLVDRQLPLSLPFMSAGSKSGGHPSRYDRSHQRNVVISTCGFHTTEGNYDALLAQLDHLFGAGAYERVLCAQGELFRVPELSDATNRYLDAVRHAGEEFARGGIAEATCKRLAEPLFPREQFEAMADASWGVGDTGEALDESEQFTRQMAALYNPASWSGADRTLQMNYTDVGHAYQITMGEKGVLVESGMTAKADDPGVTRVNTPLSVWQQIARGETSGTDAMMRHLYTVEGDFSLMLDWDRYFGAATPNDDVDGKDDQAASGKKDVRTSMLAMLLPWTVLWSVAPAQPFAGAVASLLACGLIPLAFSRYRLTAYDRISLAVVAAGAAALLLGFPTSVVIPVTYLAFGIMWLLSLRTPIPLCANYSMYGYGGRKALQNAVFMRTNAILAAGWGVLYVVLAGAIALLYQAGMAGATGVATMVPTAVMGVFTGWFQRWYPARVARG